MSIIAGLLIYSGYTKPALACACEACIADILPCSVACSCESTDKTSKERVGNISGGTIGLNEHEFAMHEEWIIKNIWEGHVLPSMMMMAEQVTTMAMLQMEVIGGFFDAKHQLESQRLLQDLQAQAHKDYHPSAGMCRFGTNTRSLAAADRNVDFNQVAIATRSTNRILLNTGTIGTGGTHDDLMSRLSTFRSTYCNPADYGNALDLLCQNEDAVRMNKDINYTNNVQDQDTLLINFADNELTEEERDVMALSANLYGHRLLPKIQEIKIANTDGTWIIDEGVITYMDSRALAAKRSVAFNSFAAQAAMKSQGPDAVLPYMEEVLLEMGIPTDVINEMLKGGPSYNAQMEILSKKLYQHPNFYANLYDKPVNIDRKDVAMQAIALMQKRDMYRSQLRSEANMAVWLETEIEDLQEYYTNEANALKEEAEVLELF